jgi:hemolysin activation/secretion protein
VARGETRTTFRTSDWFPWRCPFFRAWLILVLSGAAATLPAEAQTPQPILTNPVPQGSPIPRILPTAPPAVSTEGVEPLLPAAGGAVTGPPVSVSQVSVEGVTVYPPGDIAAMASGLAGHTVPFAQIDAVRVAIAQRYRADGYVLSTVAATYDAQTGRLRYVVTEGHIASVKLDGDIGPAGTQVLRFLNRLTEPAVLDAATLERYLLLARDVPGISLHAVLQASTDQPGALNLIAQVSRQAVSGLIATDNRASKFTGPIETLAGLSLNSFTELGEKTEISLYHAWPNSETFGQIASEAFVGSSGLRVQIYGGAGATVPTGPLAQLSYRGVTQVFGAKASYPFIRSRRQTLSGWLSFDGINTEIDTNVGGPVTSADSVRVLRLGGDYALSDLWAGVERPAVDILSIRLSEGLDILGASGGGTNPPRLGEHPNFTKINFQASRTQTLFAPWQGADVAVMGLLAGQWSPSVLPPAEQFYLGGTAFTRGYYAGQVAGDKALAATAELQLNTGVDLSRLGLSTEVNGQFYLFYDWGEAWQNQSGIGTTRIASAGGGARFQITRYVEVDLEGLARLNRFPNGAAVSALDGAAFYWRVLLRY